MQRDEAEGRQFQGRTLETFRDTSTGAIRVRGGMAGGFTVVIQECGAVAIHYERRSIHVAPGTKVSVERMRRERQKKKPIGLRIDLPANPDAPSPRAAVGARRRGSR
jgi:hypothetical protein